MHAKFYAGGLEHEEGAKGEVFSDRARRGQAPCPQDKPVDSPLRGPRLDHRSPTVAFGLSRFACRKPLV